MDNVKNQKASASSDAAYLIIEIPKVEKDMKQLELMYNKVRVEFGSGELETQEQQMVYLRNKLQTLVKQHKQQMQSKRTDYNAVPVEEATFQQVQELKQQKDQGLDTLHNQIKEVNKVNRVIKDEINKGDEIADDLKNGINTANVDVQKATGAVQGFRNYLKSNKLPFPLAILVLILSIFIWSTQSLCKFAPQHGWLNCVKK
uniref:SNARE, putative n=1 Tax=Trepomonas sp. PC1 TaxID=1076344 RepID=A0A146KIH4_9EUKA|eukprot:JAP95938.1 SNARE, putative [Trepomonas sp. PC1]